MNNSGQEKQDQRTSSGMEDSTAITIEFLRARLLSERSVSGSARERADELAKRVAELEEQLRIMSLQRMKAEKATADVLAILESNGISDESEMFDLNSDQDTPCESKVGKKTFKEEESSVHSKVTKYKLEEHSGTDHDISSAQGRSLSWKCRKHSPRSLEKCKDPSLRRRSSFASTSSSPKHHQGKSRRQIRSKESRSTTEAFRASPDKVDSPENGVATTSEVFPNCSEPEARGIENGEEKALPPISDGLENGQHADSNELEDDVYGSDRDMEKALEHQAQLIDRYEAMEKAQREWEEKFRENNGSTPDSYDLGNRSDVTEEGYEIKAQAAPHDGTVAAQSNWAKLEVENASNIQPNGILPPSHVNTGQLQEWKSSSTPASESSAQDFAFHAEKQKQNQESLGNNYHPSLHSFHHHPHSHSSHDSPGSQSAASFPSNTDSGFSKGQSASNIQPNGILLPSHVNTGQLQEWKSSSTPASGSSAQDFAFHAEKQKQNQESLGNNYHPSLHSSHHHPHSHSPHDSPGSQSAASFPSNTDSGFRKGQSAYNIQPNGILPPSHVNTGQLQEWKSSSTPASESSAQDFAFHAEKQKQNQESLGNNYHPSLHSSHHHPHSHSSHDSPGSQSAASFPSNTDSGFSKGQSASNIQPNGILLPSHVNTGQLQEWKSSSTPASGSSAQDFAFHAEKQKQNQESLGNNYHPSLHSSHHHPHSHSPHDSPGSQSAASFPSNTDSGFRKGQSAYNIQPNGILPPSHVNTGQLQEWKSSSTPASESSAQDFAFHAEKQKQNQESLGNNYHPSLHSSHHHPHSHSSHDSPGSQSAASFPSNTDSGFSKGQASGRQNDLYALVPHRASNELGGVLDALKQARQSLRQRIGTLPLIEGGSIRNSVNPSLPSPIPGDKVDIPLGNVGLFRLPTDFLVEGSARTNLLSSNARLSLGNYYPDTGVPAAASNRFVSRSYSATGSRFPAEDRFLASQYVEGGSRVSSQRPFFYPYVDTVLPPSGRYTYPTNPSYPDQIPPLPSREPPSFLPSRTTGVPPADHFSFSDHHIRPNMYR